MAGFRESGDSWLGCEMFRDLEGAVVPGCSIFQECSELHVISLFNINFVKKLTELLFIGLLNDTVGSLRRV